jgi:hypothetical protein
VQEVARVLSHFTFPNIVSAIWKRALAPASCGWQEIKQGIRKLRVGRNPLRPRTSLQRVNLARRSALNAQHEQTTERAMPILLPVLIGAPILLGGTYLIYTFVR